MLFRRTMSRRERSGKFVWNCFMHRCDGRLPKGGVGFLKIGRWADIIKPNCYE
jgi:hypothetical protein